MQIAYSKDLSERSYSFSVMPDALAQALPLYPCSCGMFECRSGYYTRRSGLANYLLIDTIDGEGELEVETGVIPLLPGSAVLIDCMRYHRYATAHGGKWRFYYVHFQGHMEVFAPILTPRGAIRLEDPGAFEALFERLLHTAREAAPTSCFVYNQLLTQMLTTLSIACYDPHTDARVQRHLPELNRCIDYLRENYASNIALSDMAAQMHLSKYHFIRVFQAYMRTTPYAYLLDLRMSVSRELLLMTDESVQEIARRVGIHDCNMFIRTFKKRFGETPTIYRRLWRGRAGMKTESMD